MRRLKKSRVGSPSGLEFILMGLALALLGAGAVMLMIVGLSLLYVGRYRPAAALLFGFLVAGGLFLKWYGPYLVRLEERASTVPASLSDETDDGQPGIERSQPRATEADEDSRAEPLPVSVIIALAAAAYGLLIALGGVIWTEGKDLVLNLSAGGGLLFCAAVVWRMGRCGRPAEQVDQNS
jgi:hypothetical protein